MPISSAAATAIARGVSAGAGEMPAHVPRCPGRSHRPSASLQALLQHTSFTQNPVAHSLGVAHAPPCGMPVLVGVTVGVLVGVAVLVAVAVAVAGLVAVPVFVAGPVLVAVAVEVVLGVLVGVAVGVEVGALPAHVPSQNPNPLACWRHEFWPATQLSATPPEQSATVSQHARWAEFSAVAQARSQS